MIKLSMQLDGLDTLEAKLSATAYIGTLRQPMYDSMLLLQRDLGRYPAEPTGSKYARTRVLGNRWRAGAAVSYRQGPGFIKGKLSNNVEYAPWVQSHLFQAQIHQGRWVTDKQVLQKNKSRIVRLFQRAIWKKLGS